MPNTCKDPRCHDAGRILKRHEKIAVLTPAYTMPEEFQNSVSVSKIAKFVIVPFSISAAVVKTHFAGRILCRFHHKANIYNSPYCPYCRRCFIYRD